jgi:hypothetical protein
MGGLVKKKIRGRDYWKGRFERGSIKRKIREEEL